jgi:hypothetical protein
MKFQRSILLTAILASLISCSPKVSQFTRNELAEMKSCTGNKFRFKLKTVIIPYVIDGDVGIPEHGESLWIGSFLKNKTFNKIKLIQLIDSLNANCNTKYAKFRMPTEVEKVRFKLDRKVISYEQFISIKEEEEVSTEDVLIVKVYLGETSGEEF